MFNFFEKKDSQLQDDVIKELNWDPSVSESQIAVTVKDGIVSLRGSVPHFYEKSRAELAAQRINGVRAVVDELEVDLMGIHKRSDEEIARVAITALQGSYYVPKDLKVVVNRGQVTLSGQVDWGHQKNSAANVVRPLMGVMAVINDIEIKPAAKVVDVKNRIEESLKRIAEKEAKGIQVMVNFDRVTLNGIVHTFSEIADAEYAAWSAPGVMAVENNLKLGYE
ncbi:MAG: BON domain-containing protein [Bacteriovoracaceae bacterium]|nr:BON domain-containing protein [Bacteriovoracaceae bacterium]